MNTLKLLALASVVSATVGCTMSDADLIDSVDSGDAPIVMGETLHPRAPEIYGVGLTDASCTVTLVENNVGVTHEACANISTTVTVGTVTAKIRHKHRLVDQHRDASRDLWIVTLKSPVPLSGTPFGRRPDPTPAVIGEVLNCYGYTGGKVRVGPFEVGDDSNDKVLNLRGRATTYGVAEADIDDVGGYCARDGETHPVAIITWKTVGGITTAEPVAGRARGFDGAVMLGKSAAHGAIRLLDETETYALTGNVGDDYTIMDQYAAHPSRAFYRVPVAAGGGPWVRFVDVEAGDCVTRDSGDVRLHPCGGSGQTFLEHVEHIDGYDRYSYLDPSGREAITDAGNNIAMPVWPWDGQPNQRFRMWLAPY